MKKPGSIIIWTKSIRKLTWETFPILFFRCGMLWKVLSKILLFLQFLSLQNGSFWLIIPGQYLLILVTKVHCLKVPVSFASNFGMLIICQWPRLNPGTGARPVCIEFLLQEPSPPQHSFVIRGLAVCHALVRVVTRSYRMVQRNKGLLQEIQMPCIVQPVKKKMLKWITSLTNISRFYLTCVEEHSRSSRI